jgi:phenylalanyl-tRNA synthetase beta subunit
MLESGSRCTPTTRTHSRAPSWCVKRSTVSIWYLDDVDRALSAEDLLITDDSGRSAWPASWAAGPPSSRRRPANRAGGGSFRSASIGRTFRRHKLASEASVRFARGVDPALPLAAARAAARLMAELGGGKLADDYTLTGEVPVMPTQRIRADLPAGSWGAQISAQQVVDVLRASCVEVTEQPMAARPGAADLARRPGGSLRQRRRGRMQTRPRADHRRGARVLPRDGG